jgi:uncharacterized damage-inducible protein DinB
MISPDHVRAFARYNLWQNASLYREAEALGEVERRLPRGAFFSTIHATLNHLLWADQIWMHRFAGTPKPEGGIKQSAWLHAEWADLAAGRRQFDQVVLTWADGLDAGWLGGDMTWFSGAQGRDVSKPRWLLVAHMFNHQTHHRGQIHAMLTAAGGRPDDTDLPFMPAEWAEASPA